MPGQNTDVIRRFYEEVLNKGDLDRVAEFCSEDIVDHEAPPEFPKGIEGVQAFIQTFHDGFPDLNTTVEDAFEEGDRAVVRARWTGTHQGEFMGFPPAGTAWTSR